MDMESIKIKQDRIVIGGNIKKVIAMVKVNLLLPTSILMKAISNKANSMDLVKFSFWIKVIIKVYLKKVDGQKKEHMLTRMVTSISLPLITKMTLKWKCQ